jgi:hypothetical protein
VIDCEARIKIEECLKTTKFGNYLAFEDAFMVAIVYFKDGTQSTLCVCGPLSKDIYRDGVLIEENYRLLYLIKLYSGYYSWFDKEERGMILELWDSEWNEPITMTAETNPQVKIVNVEN